jgi:sulfite reductase (ferredoxin)
VLDVPEHEVAPLQAGLAELGLDSNPSEFRRGALACTGIEFCKLALVETKNRTDALVTELERRLPDFDSPLSIHVNGCPNACARTQVADIGLKGMVIPDPGTGEYVEGYQVHLGGAIGPEAGLARKTRALKVSATELPDYVERIAGRYLDQRGPGESFAHWARRADEEDLR